MGISLLLILVLSFSIVGLSCGESREAEDTDKKPSQTAPKDVEPTPLAPAPAPALKDSEVIVSKAQLRAMCQLPSLPGIREDSNIAVFKLSQGEKTKQVPSILITASMGSISSDYSTPNVYFGALGFSATGGGPNVSSFCAPVREYPQATILAVLLRDGASKSQKGYWGYSDVIAEDDMQAKPVFLGDVEEDVARAKVVELMQHAAGAHFGSRLEALSPIDSRWADAFKAASN